MEEADTFKFNVVLPTQRPPRKLSHLQSTPLAQFLVGYRNVLVGTVDGVSWGLVKNDAFCGRAFVFEIPEDDANHIQQIRDSGEMVEIVGSSYLLLKIQNEISKPKDPISQEQLQRLLELIGGVNTINLNIIKNAFDSMQQYQEIAGKAVQKLTKTQQKVEISVADKVKLQYNGKTLSGQGLLSVPVISKQTGNIAVDQTLKLKL